MKNSSSVAWPAVVRPPGPDPDRRPVGELPLSYGQQQMWFLNRLDPTSAEYIVSSALRLRGPLDADALRRR